MTANPCLMLGLLLGLAAAGPAGPAGAPPAAAPRPPAVSSGGAAAATAAAPAAPAHAEEIVAELAAVLSRLGATDPIQGTLELQLSRQSSEEHWTDQSRVTVEVEDGPGIHHEPVARRLPPGAARAPRPDPRPGQAHSHLQRVA